jgi:hypothetical protein
MGHILTLHGCERSRERAPHRDRAIGASNARRFVAGSRCFARPDFANPSGTRGYQLRGVLRFLEADLQCSGGNVAFLPVPPGTEF